MKVLLVDQIAKVNYKYTYSLANALLKQGICVDIAIDKKKEEENCPCKKIRLFNTAEKNIGKLRKLCNYIVSSREIIKRAKHYDILHTQWIIFSPLDYYILRKIKKKGNRIVITIHDILPFDKKFYDYCFHKKIYELADSIILQTDENIARFKELFPQNTLSHNMIPHGHFMDYAEIIDKNEARRTLEIPEDKFVYLFFGQIKKVKGLHILLESYAKLLNDNPEMVKTTQLVIAGNIWKDDIDRYKKIVYSNDLSSVVKMDIRYIPDEEVDIFYSSCDVCVLPYLNVYQSGVLQLTYAHHRVPIVTDLEAFTDVVNSEIGFVCEANNVDSLKEKMLIAYQNKDNLQLMSEKGYDAIKKRFDWNIIAQRIKNIYLGVTNDAQKN